jgi:hypothetical protein
VCSDLCRVARGDFVGADADVAGVDIFGAWLARASAPGITDDAYLLGA